MKSILILGAKGTLGQALLQEFSHSDYQVTAWDREEADLTDVSTKEKILNLQPEIIVNATGYNVVDKCEVDSVEKEMAFKINATVPEMLAQIAKDLNAIFVNYSSDYVFKGDKESGYTENDLPDPASIYGESKFEGEKLVQAVGGKYYIIRPSRMFGTAGISIMSKKNFVDIMVGKKDETEIKVVNEERSSPTYAPDLAKFTRVLIEENKPFGIYHGANSGACTWYEWAEEIFKIIGANPKLAAVSGDEFPRPAKRPQFSELLNTKMPPQRSWQDALRAYLDNHEPRRFMVRN
ncbi:MAG: dTDP-4-dehydrorhamnose reductase [Candidatus Magasanikbacteria bacterium GW2011_GWA2_37_8]|uniref:dTDP-4-dehydrorhamnose reductase n=1 Tax=Candidatus Magasanikbacteria bacterium GW2011_GWA2_37_8 TaxID=1619036 RepID=A0A0G0KIV7_9BACT|nr:MAG: dTDP-4-dehydrorhamnose reductase [Candidatus Magasanikbacteria bacterium GW2011_GWA2_37_8]